MAISEKDVEHIAQLARLALTAEEKRLYQNQLGRILESMAELGNLDTSQIPPTSSVLGTANVFREDEPMPFENVEAILANAPEREGPYFKVKKVLNK